MKETICSNTATFLFDLREVCQCLLLLCKKRICHFFVFEERNGNGAQKGFVTYGIPHSPFSFGL